MTGVSLTDSAMILARNLFGASVRPLGAARVKRMFDGGLPDVFRPPLEYLFSRQLARAEAEVQSRVEAIRSEFERRDGRFHVISNQGTLVQKSAYNLARLSSVTSEWGVFLYLCAKSFRAQRILELGSCIGISGSYFAASPYCKQFIGLEGAKDVVGIANANVKRISRTATILFGNADDKLVDTLTEFDSNLDLIYIDANHHYEPTQRYLNLAAPHLNSGALVIFDDIHWSKEMWDAWCVLRNRQGFSHTLDVGRFGLCLWQGGTVRPKTYELAWYAGWVWKYATRKP